MHKKSLTTLLTGAALLVGFLPIANGEENSAGQSALDWSEKYSWQLGNKAVDFVHSLDNKRVYVLEADSRVHIYTAEGSELGSLPVSKDVTDIDIAPRGEILYAIDGKTNTFTAYDIGFVRDIDITGSPFLGKKEAPVALVVFSDFQ